MMSMPDEKSLKDLLDSLGTSKGRLYEGIQEGLRRAARVGMRVGSRGTILELTKDTNAPTWYEEDDAPLMIAMDKISYVVKLKDGGCRIEMDGGDTVYVTESFIEIHEAFGFAGYTVAAKEGKCVLDREEARLRQEKAAAATTTAPNAPGSYINTPGSHTHSSHVPGFHESDGMDPHN